MFTTQTYDVEIELIRPWQPPGNPPATIFATRGDWTAGWSRRWLGRAARQVEQRLVGPRTTLSVEALARDLRSAHREVIEARLGQRFVIPYRNGGD